MAGYVAMARITHVAPHRASHHEPIVRDAAAVIDLGDDAVEEISGEPFLATLTYWWGELTYWWDDVREIWRQGMDVLRDPQIY